MVVVSVTRRSWQDRSWRETTRANRSATATSCMRNATPPASNLARSSRSPTIRSMRLRLLADDAEIARSRRLVEGEVGHGQRLDVAADRRERRRQLVRDVREQLPPRAVGGLELGGPPGQVVRHPVEGERHGGDLVAAGRRRTRVAFPAAEAPRGVLEAAQPAVRRAEDQERRQHTSAADQDERQSAHERPELAEHHAPAAGGAARRPNRRVPLHRTDAGNRRTGRAKIRRARRPAARAAGREPMARVGRVRPARRIHPVVGTVRPAGRPGWPVRPAAGFGRPAAAPGPRHRPGSHRAQPNERVGRLAPAAADHAAICHDDERRALQRAVAALQVLVEIQDGVRFERRREVRRHERACTGERLLGHRLLGAADDPEGSAACTASISREEQDESQADAPVEAPVPARGQTSANL